MTRRGARLAMLVSVLAALAGCGKDNVTSPPGNSDPTLADAWILYERGSYVQSDEVFARVAAGETSHSERKRAGLVGSGWCRLAMAQPAAALQKFREAARNGRHSYSLDLVGRLGFCLSVDLAREEPAEAISTGESILSEHPRYVFPHDARIDWIDLTAALLHMHLRAGHIDQVVQLLESLGDPPLDESSPAFSVQLIEAVDRWTARAGNNGGLPAGEGR